MVQQAARGSSTGRGGVHVQRPLHGPRVPCQDRAPSTWRRRLDTRRHVCAVGQACIMLSQHLDAFPKYHLQQVQRIVSIILALFGWRVGYVADRSIADRLGGSLGLSLDKA
ncbi:hypothetical protein PG988_007602 [Apiospora saccharicola]